ncbi:MAG: type II secretion system F family protein [Acidobacteriota bacterium]|nr:type II secretion system F family protein [Acidobacteriota bacterium]
MNHPDHNQVLCPKCDKGNPAGSTTCAFCSIIFARYRPDRPKPRVKPRRGTAPLGLFAMSRTARFLSRLARTVGAGIPLQQALRQSSGNEKLPVQQITRFLDTGAGLTDACARSGIVWPAYVWAHLEAGERSGRLPEMLESLADEIMARRKRILAQIFNWRTIWFALIIIGGTVTLALTETIRNLSAERVQEGTESVLAGLALGTVTRIFLFGGSASALVLGFLWFQLKGKYLLTQRFPRIEEARLRLPLFGDILRGETLARYLTLLGRMLGAGLPLPESLDLARADIEFPNWQKSFRKIQEAVLAGNTLSRGMAAVPHMPADLIAEIEVGETTGDLAEGMERYADLMRENLARLHQTAGWVTGAALVGFGFLVGLLILLRGMTSWIELYERVL